MKSFGRAALAAVMALSGAAHAQEIDFDLERLRLDPSARGSLVLGSGEVLAPEKVRLSATYHFERRPLVLSADGDLRGRGLLDERTRLSDAVTNRSTVHVGAAIGLFQGFELGLEVPYIVDQTGDGSGLGSDGLAAPWLRGRYGLPLAGPLAAAVSVAVSPDWGDGERFNGDRGFSFVPGVEVGLRMGGSLLMANVAARLRTSEVLLTNGEELSHELDVGLGWATTGRPLRFEVSGHGTFDQDGIGQRAELLAGVRYALGPAELYALGGPGFFELPGTPTFRGLAGVAFDFGGAAPPPPAPPPAPVQVDPCAPGQAHTPEQCPALDDDGDGVANGQDRCPREAGIAANGGCPAKDSDGDGVADHEDRCADVKGTAEHQGCPPPDSDGDGVLDADDKCPNQPGVPAEQGCPPARAQINVETKKIEITEKVYFDSNKAAIQERSFKLLDDVAALLVANPSVATVVIEGHTDDRGEAEYNKSLSQRRAEAVKTYLVDKGVAEGRLVPEGFGEERPAQPNTTAAGREANRRVEFLIRDAAK